MSNFSQNTKNPDYHKNIQRAQQQIRYHQPLQRLERRSKFQNLMKERLQEDTLVLKKDNFLIFDAIVKRGGYKEVCNHNRWQEINISMQYQKKMWGISKYYQQILLAHEEWLRAQMECYEDIIQYQFIEMHLLTPNNLTAAYYQLTPAQYMFVQSNYFSIDEYYNLKTLALSYNQIPAIPIQFADKFMILRRRLLFTQQVRPASLKQLSNYGICNNSENKVIIIGCSLSSLIIADTLTDFGIKVIIIDKNKNQIKYSGKREIVDYGLTLLEGHKGQGSYHTYLSNLDINVEQFSGICALLDEEGKLTSQEKIRVSEQHFMSIIDQMKSQVMNKKKLYEEIISRVARKKWQHEKSLIRWHYDRYILFNRLKGESTTVGDIATYQNKKFVKHLTQPYSIISLRNINKLYQKIKNKKNIEIVTQAIDHMSYNDGFWNVRTRNDSFSAKYFIYSDQESICKSVLEGSSRLADIGSDILGQSAVVLQYLTVLKYINCHYVFRDKLVLRDNLKGMSCFTLNSIYGYIYFFIMPSNNEVLAVLRCYHQTSINYFTELLVIFENKCIAKTNKMIGQQSWNFDYSFSLKDQKFIEMLIRIKPNQKMYIMLPITSTHCSHPLQTQIDITTHISNLILQEIYPNYTYYNPSLIAHLKQASTVPKSQQSLCSQRVINAANQNNSGIFSQQAGTKNAQQYSGVQICQNLPELKSLASRQKKESQVILQGLKLQKKQLTSQECDHIFGLNHQIIKNYILQVQSRFNLNNPKAQTKIQSQQELYLRQNLLLYSLGQPYLKKKEWFNESLGIDDIQLFYPLDRMVTRREYFSLRNSLKTTTYYQIVVVVKYNLYYCIIEESQPQNIYFHNQLTILLNKLNQTLCKLRQEQFQEDPSRKMNKIKRTKITPHPPKCLTPAMITQIIQQQIASLSNQQKLEDLLGQKFSNTLSSSYSQRFMVASNQVEHVSPAPFSDTILINQLLDIDTRVSIIMAEMLYFRDKLSLMASLKNFSLFQLFFGVLNQQYICCEIMNKFSEKPYNYHEIQSQDSQLCQEIREVFSKSVANQQYSIFIVPQPGSVAIKRNFIDRKNQNEFQPYCYLFEIQNQCIKHYLIMGKHKIYFRDKDEIITYILKSLVINHNSSQIVQLFQEMITQDVDCQLRMSPKLKLYYLMTKKQIKKPYNGNSAAIFSQKCKDLNRDEKLELSKLMKNNKIRWIDNDFLYVVK